MTTTTSEALALEAADIADRLALVSSPTAVRSRALGAIAGGDSSRRAIEETLNQVYRDAAANPAELGTEAEIRSAAREAQRALQSVDLRSRLCSVLRGLTGKSSREITLETTKLLLPLAAAGTIAVPASALAWALLGFTAACLGSSILCGDEPTRE